MTSSGWCSPARARAKLSCNSPIAAGVSHAGTVAKRKVSLPSGSIWVIEFLTGAARGKGEPAGSSVSASCYEA
jgi:hypothetical protein